MQFLLLKLFLAPTLIAMTTLIARRWGGQVGGLVGGLPLTSGIICFLIGLDHGSSAAVLAAEGALTGFIGVVSFCVAYSYAAGSQEWEGSLFFALFIYIITTIFLELWAPSFIEALIVLLIVLVVSLFILPTSMREVVQRNFPKWDIPARMFVAMMVVVGLTSLSMVLGASFVGMLAPLPIFSSILACFAHKQAGAHAARCVLRGFVLAGFASAAFFAMIVYLLPVYGGMAYVIAVVVSLIVDGLALQLTRLSYRLRHLNDLKGYG